MNEEEIKAIDRLKYALIYDREGISTLMGFNDIKKVLQLVDKQQKEIEEMREELQMYVDTNVMKEKQQTEIEELKKIIKMVEIYKIHGIPENVEMVIMRKDDFLRNANNEFISKDTIREKIKEYDKWIEKGEYTESLEAQRYALNKLLEE